MKAKVNSIVGITTYKACTIYINFYAVILTSDAPKNRCPRNVCLLRYHLY